MPPACWCNWYRYVNVDGYRYGSLLRRWLQRAKGPNKWRADMREGMEQCRNGHAQIIGKARNGHYQTSTHERYSFWRRYLEIFNVDLEFYSNHRHRATEGFTSPIWELTTLRIQCMVIMAKLTMFSTHLRRYRNTYHPIGIFIGPRTESHVLSELGNKGARELYKRHCVSSMQSMVAHIGYK